MRGVGEIELMAAVSALKVANPDIGVKRLLQSLRSSHPDWSVDSRVVRDALKVIEDTAAPRVESGKKEQEGEKHAAQAAEQFSEHDCEKLNIGIAKIFRPHGNIPRPSLDQAVVPPTWDATSLFDICDTASMAYELSSSGVNGLRYASFEHDVSELSGLLHVVSTEVCSASEEDVSSIIKYTSSDGLSDTNIMKAY